MSRLQGKAGLKEKESVPSPRMGVEKGNQFVRERGKYMLSEPH